MAGMITEALDLLVRAREQRAAELAALDEAIAILTAVDRTPLRRTASGTLAPVEAAVEEASNPPPQAPVAVKPVEKEKPKRPKGPTGRPPGRVRIFLPGDDMRYHCWFGRPADCDKSYPYSAGLAKHQRLNGHSNSNPRRMNPVAETPTLERIVPKSTVPFHQPGGRVLAPGEPVQPGDVAVFSPPATATVMKGGGDVEVFDLLAPAPEPVEASTDEPLSAGLGYEDESNDPPIRMLATDEPVAASTPVNAVAATATADVVARIVEPGAPVDEVASVEAFFDAAVAAVNKGTGPTFERAKTKAKARQLATAKTVERGKGLTLLRSEFEQANEAVKAAFVPDLTVERSRTMTGSCSRCFHRWERHDNEIDTTTGDCLKDCPVCAEREAERAKDTAAG